MGVEPTILAAKDRINGFEGHEDHRAPGASAVRRTQRIPGLMRIHNFRLRSRSHNFSAAALHDSPPILYAVHCMNFSQAAARFVV